MSFLRACDCYNFPCEHNPAGTIDDTAPASSDIFKATTSAMEQFGQSNFGAPKTMADLCAFMFESGADWRLQWVLELMGSFEAKEALREYRNANGYDPGPTFWMKFIEQAARNANE